MRLNEDVWERNGALGIVYTTDWKVDLVIYDRMHWTLAEAINTSVVLYHITDNERYVYDYAQFMEYLNDQVLDHVNGSWFHKTDEKRNITESLCPREI